MPKKFPLCGSSASWVSSSLKATRLSFRNKIISNIRTRIRRHFSASLRIWSESYARIISNFQFMLASLYIILKVLRIIFMNRQLFIQFLPSFLRWKTFNWQRVDTDEEFPALWTRNSQHGRQKNSLFYRFQTNQSRATFSLFGKILNRSEQRNGSICSITRKGIWNFLVASTNYSTICGDIKSVSILPMSKSNIFSWTCKGSSKFLSTTDTSRWQIT